MAMPRKAATGLGKESILRIRETQLREAMALARIGTWEWDVVRGTVIWSPELRRILGVGADVEATARNFLDRVHPEDRAWAESSARDTLRTGVAHETPFRIVRPDESVRVVRGRACASHFENARPVYLVGAIQDLGGGSLFPEFHLASLALRMMSKREREVLILVVDGGTSKEIAEALALSPKTVDTYRSRVMSKLGIEDLAGLVRFAIRYGLTVL
jgi:DNA-binding CsgD family transcriptional regulator